MTVSTTTRRAGPYDGNGSATEFPFTFKVFAGSDLQVFLTTANVTVEQEMTADYTVSLNADQTNNPGGTVTMLVAPAVNASVAIQGAVPYTQTLALPQGGNFNPLALENALDRATMQVIQLADAIELGPIPGGVSLSGLPDAAARADKLLGFDSDGEPVAVAPTAGSAAALAIDLASTSNPAHGSGQVGFVQAGAGATGRTSLAKMRDVLNVKDFGASSDQTDAENKTCLGLAIAAASAAGGATIIVPRDIAYGVKTTDRSTWPSFSGVTAPVTIEDYSPGNSYAGFPTAYDGAQIRLWSFTPQTTSAGQHDGNTHWMRGAWAPNYIVSNDMDLSGARDAGDNRRAYFVTAVEGLATWTIGSGTRIGADLTDEEMSNFTITKYSQPLLGDTLGDYSPMVVERKTGNISFGSGANIPVAHHQFGRVPTSPNLNLVALVSNTTTADLLLRDSVGAADDVFLENVAGDANIRLGASGIALQVKKTTRRVQISQALALAKVNLTYSASVTPNSDAGNIFQIFATNSTAFAINAPTGTLSDGQEIVIRISNTSGGALGTVTWNAAFKMSAWTQPANGFGRSIRFYYDLATPGWVQVGGASVDVPN